MLYCCMSYLPETPQLWIGIVLFSKVPKFVDSILTILLTAFTLGKVPECGTHRVLILMWTHVFFNYPCCNKVTVPGCPSLRSRPCTQAQQWASGPCVHTSVVSYKTTASYSLQSSSFQVASDSVKGSNYVDSFISGTQDVNKTPHCASSKALVPRLPTKCTQPLCFILTAYYHNQRYYRMKLNKGR